MLARGVNKMCRSSSLPRSHILEVVLYVILLDLSAVHLYPSVSVELVVLTAVLLEVMNIANSTNTSWNAMTAERVDYLRTSYDILLMARTE